MGVRIFIYVQIQLPKATVLVIKLLIVNFKKNKSYESAEGTDTGAGSPAERQVALFKHTIH